MIYRFFIYMAAILNFSKIAGVTQNHPIKFSTLGGPLIENALKSPGALVHTGTPIATGVFNVFPLGGILDHKGASSLEGIGT